MNAALRTSLIVGAGVAGAGALAVALFKGGEQAKERRETETPFSSFKAYPSFDANGDGRIDRSSEVLRFSEGGLKTGASYSSIRVVADAADMVVGNRDGFATASEFADLARTYTTRPGATGLNDAERSVFAEDYGIRLGDGGSVEEMRGNPYF